MTQLEKSVGVGMHTSINTTSQVRNVTKETWKRL